MKEVKEAVPVRLFAIEGHQQFFKKVTAAEAKGDEKAVQALFGSTISWFLPYNQHESEE